GEKLSVDPVYVIQGSVDLGTGNVSHKGAVVISEDITAGFRIEALGDIEVAGVVEPSWISAEGNLVVRGGITGSPENRIEVKGNLSARFIQDAIIEMQGDIIVESEIMHSTIRTLGKLSIPRGRFVGGSIIARGGIELKEAGGAGATPTLLAAGEDYLLQQQLEPRQANLKRFEANLEKMKIAVEPMMSRIKLLNSKQREALTALMAKITEIDMEVTTLQQEIADLENESREQSVREIHISGVVYPETTLRIDGCGFRVLKTTMGPLRAILVARKIVLEHR
ncbi:MAG TPA: FapA family protein, partial [bacterium]|nr:FapA family protein [bacterium]